MDSPPSKSSRQPLRALADSPGMDSASLQAIANVPASPSGDSLQDPMVMASPSSAKWQSILKAGDDAKKSQQDTVPTGPEVWAARGYMESMAASRHKVLLKGNLDLAVLAEATKVGQKDPHKSDYLPRGPRAKPPPPRDRKIP